MSMFQVVRSALKLYVATTRHFIQVQPLRTLALVFSSLVAQVALLLAFLLPIKIVLMLGSSRVPRYFPDFMRSLPREELVIYSCLTAVLAFVVYSVAQKFVSLGVDRVTSTLLENNNKITPLSNHVQMSSKIYKAYIDSLSSLSFILLAFSLINFLYEHLSYVVMVYIIIFLGATVAVAQMSPRFSGYLDKKLGKFLWFAGTLGFLVAFGFIVIDFLVPLDPPQFFFALIGLLFSRQLLIRFVALVQNIRSLYLSRSKSAALFFDGYIDDVKKSQNEGSVWEMFADGYAELWARQVLQEFLGGEVEAVKILRISSFRPGVFSCVVESYVGEANSSIYLLKLFSKEKTVIAEKEHYFLTENVLFGEAARYIGFTLVGDFRCHLYSWDNGDKIVRITREVRLFLEESCLRYEIPQRFASLYTNSHALLGQRVSKKMIDRLNIFASDDHRAPLNEVSDNFDFLTSAINRLPLQLVFPGVSGAIARADGEVLLLDHDAWRLEPLGFGWSIGDSDEEIHDLLLRASGLRGDIDDSLVSSVFLCKKMAEFEKKYRTQNFDAAIDCVISLSKRLAMLKRGQEVRTAV